MKVGHMKPTRPQRTYRSGIVIRLIRVLALVAMVGIVSHSLAIYASLPEVIPTHVDLRGEADDFGSRSSLLWLNALMLVLGVLLAWLSLKPRSFNYPLELTEANAQPVYREGERMMVLLLAALAVVHLGVVLAVAGQGGAVLIACGVSATLIVTLVGVVRIAIVSARAEDAARAQQLSR